MKHNVGNCIKFKSFCYINNGGGTGMSDMGDICYTKSVTGIIIKAWDDYEIGERYWIKPNENDKELIEFLDKVAIKAFPNPNIEKQPIIANTYVLFVGEFDLA